MRTGLSVVAGLAVLTAWALTPCLGAKRVEVQPVGVERDKPGKDRPDKEGIPFGKSATFGDDLEQVDSLVTLKDDQKKKLGEIKGQRDKALERYDQMYQPKVAKAEANLGKLRDKEGRDHRAAELCKRLETFLKSTRTNRQRRAEGYERRMFAVLTPDQRAKWNGPILTQEMIREFSGVSLEPKQEGKIETICKARAKRLTIPLDPEKHASALNPIKALICKSVLTKKQQAKYRRDSAPVRKTSKGRDKEK